ncbi:MAG: AbrB family transcriptional regulator [Alphaproteobacteria bacterium]|nr:AbrB family transcriptional regulator [Alphaproteobacteria bacterium]
MRALTLPSTFWPAALCIAIAFAGGFAFNFFQFPLAFMLGAIAFTMVAAIAGVPIARPNAHIVTPMRASLGVLLGSAVTPELLDRVGALGAAAAFVPIFVTISGVVGTLYYHKVARFTREEAFFCALPGGLHVMTIYAEECGVDIRRVALAHALRITFVVLLTPLAVSVFTFVPRVDVTTVSASILDIARDDMVLLLIAGVIGWYLGRKTRIPGAQMLGPMLASAALHIAGITAAKPPVEIIILSQIIIGASIGARYVGETLAIVRTSIVYAFGHVSITLAIAALFAYVLHLIFDLPVITGMLSFAPGGMSEIGLIALGLGLDVGFVATIQVSRLSTIALFAPWAFQRLRTFLKD